MGILLGAAVIIPVTLPSALIEGFSGMRTVEAGACEKRGKRTGALPIKKKACDREVPTAE